jgi:glycyl-tRNA synthetase beta chain
MPDLLLEIGCEEIPSCAIDVALSWIKNEAKQKLAAARILHGEVKVMGTPRRLVLIIHDVAATQADLSVEVTGPKVELAFDAQGQLTQAGLGFIQSKGLSAQDVFQKATPKGLVIAAQVHERGVAVGDVLPEILTKLLHNIPFVKNMRWDKSMVKFIRPVRWILCLLDGTVLPIFFGVLVSSNETCGHRFLAPQFVRVNSIKAYLDFLEKNWVMLDGQQRKAAILKEASALAEKAGGCLKLDEDLLEIVKNLVEYPWPILGHFEEKYLEVPKEILISEMREHQKYFAVINQENELLAAFIVVAGTKPKDEVALASGNTRVLKARFEDGAFYYHDDRKISFAEYLHRLNGVLFQRELGSLFNKTERIQLLTDYLCGQLPIGNELRISAARTAQLCKVDLVTGVIGQFPELQGVMGKQYALLSGEKAEVAQGIEEHYLPRFAGDALPASDIGAFVALADRMDTIVSIIGIGKAPKGSADPFALRRSGIGLAKIIFCKGYQFSLNNFVAYAISSVQRVIVLKAEILKEEVLQFIAARARGILLEELTEKKSSNAVLLIDACMGVGFDDLSDLKSRIFALNYLSQQDVELFAQLVSNLKRAGNIVAKARSEGFLIEDAVFDSDLLQEVSERDLWREIQLAEKRLHAKNSYSSSSAQRHIDLLEQVASLKPFVDRFFDEVMVMVDDAKLRQARLGLLARIEKMVCSVADFTRF